MTSSPSYNRLRNRDAEDEANKPQKVHLQIPKHILRELDAEAASKGMNRTALINHLLYKYVYPNAR
jgi:predicted DNA binding CopG/RHH family protein